MVTDVLIIGAGLTGTVAADEIIRHSDLQVVQLGRACRNAANMKVRQPAQRLYVKGFTLEKAYQDKDEQLSEIAQAGRQFGVSVKGFEKNGLAENPAWTFNGELYLQGMVNAFYNDTTMMNPDDAQAFFMAAYQSKNEGTAGEPITAKCPNSAKTVELKNLNDSLNYAFGLLNGTQIKAYLMTDGGDDFTLRGLEILFP